MTGSLTSARILVVEDNSILAMALAECLEDAGAEVLGPCSTVGGALGLLQDAGRVDVAVLDVRLEHETSEPVVALARAMGAAVLLMTGLDEESLPASLQGLPICTKPFDGKTLVGTVRALRNGVRADDAVP